VAGQAFDRVRGVEQLAHLRVAVVEHLEFGNLFEGGSIESPPGPEGINLATRSTSERHRERAARVAHRRARGHRPERDDLRDAVLAVFFGDVDDHFVAPLDAEIGVDIGHRDAVRIEEALEDQLELDRVDVGDAQDVRDQIEPTAEPRPGPTGMSRSRAYLMKSHTIRKYEAEAHLDDDAELVVRAARAATGSCSRAPRRSARSGRPRTARADSLRARSWRRASEDPGSVLRHRVVRNVEDASRGWRCRCGRR
jgi:hypothetical protein